MRVTIDKLAERRLWAFIRAKTVEVGGMGYATLDSSDSLHWSDTFLVPQEVSSSEVDFESTHGDQVAIERATTDGVLDDPAFCWVSWHSHHTMNAYWSATDDKRIAAMTKVGVNRLLSFVGCHDGKYELRLDVFGVSEHGIDIGQVTISGLKLTSEVVADPFHEAIAAELKENVKSKSYPTVHYGTKTTKKGKKAKDATPDYATEYPDAKEDLVEDLFAEGYSLKDAQEIAALGLDGITYESINGGEQ